MPTPAERLASASLYLCTDARRERADLAEFAEAALAGGVDIIQLRDKGSPGEQRYGPLEALQELEALKVLMAADGIQPIFDKAIAAATRRASELGE